MTVAKGLVTGVQLETVLRQLAKVKGFQRFDNLPIPFRAVATDLVTGTGDDGRFELRRTGAVVTSVEGLGPAVN